MGTGDLACRLKTMCFRAAPLLGAARKCAFADLFQPTAAFIVKCRGVPWEHHAQVQLTASPTRAQEQGAKHGSQLWKGISTCYFIYNMAICFCLSTALCFLSVLDDTWEGQKSFSRRIWVLWDSLLSCLLYSKAESPWNEVEVKY